MTNKEGSNTMQTYDIKNVNNTLELGLINFAIRLLCVCSFYVIYYFLFEVEEHEFSAHFM